MIAVPNVSEGAFGHKSARCSADFPYAGCHIAAGDEYIPVS